MLRRIGILAAIIISILISTQIIGETAVAAPNPDFPKWDYAELIYLSADSSANAVTIDGDERKEINQAFTSFKEGLKVDNIPAIYYANIMGRFGWELILHDADSSGELFYFKRPLSS